MIIYPEQPWSDGQTFVHTTRDGEYLTGVYDLNSDTWSFYSGNDLDTILTNNVYALNVRPPQSSIDAAAIQFDDSVEPEDLGLVTQQDVNWYLFDEIQKIRQYLIGD